jgi:hypothetical protein
MGPLTTTANRRSQLIGRQAGARTVAIRATLGPCHFAFRSRSTTLSAD